ncbi:TPA: acylphosphatase [Candidatus Dependentiae bacterium]|nr:MAG: hypothetical protein UR14_C0003G0051 [candidate division TM6 bacterium GW2011_GWE2_31_21]KKP54171.1 MAG: hypothetical protein UR43_C0001G0189 [candidate division TM6 bacterium GW2011_GWF2_33_332]HBS47893.1 acylphosphatase [Candidatus Dependentiae bacterium]HBZ73078.1 acylphosphatase [Candidatus Dependentiae bacterium]
MRRCLKILVTGKVQAVGYRKYVQAQATQLDIEGTIQNINDGSVNILICGKSTNLDEFIDVLYKGTKGSKVENVLVEPLSQTKDFRGVFRIIGMGEE